MLFVNAPIKVPALIPTKEPVGLSVGHTCPTNNNFMLK